MKYSVAQFLQIVSCPDTVVSNTHSERSQQLQSIVLILYGQVE